MEECCDVLDLLQDLSVVRLIDELDKLVENGLDVANFFVVRSYNALFVH